MCLADAICQGWGSIFYYNEKVVDCYNILDDDE